MSVLYEVSKFNVCAVSAHKEREQRSYCSGKDRLDVHQGKASSCTNGDKFRLRKLGKIWRWTWLGGLTPPQILSWFAASLLVDTTSPSILCHHPTTWTIQLVTHADGQVKMLCSDFFLWWVSWNIEMNYRKQQITQLAGKRRTNRQSYKKYTACAKGRKNVYLLPIKLFFTCRRVPSGVCKNLRLFYWVY